MNNGVINDIASLVGSGITPLRSNKKYWETPRYPWLKTEQLSEFQIFDTNEYISQAALDETSIKLWPPKTLTVAMYGEGQTRGNTSIIMREMSTNQACCNIIVDESKADYRYVYYWLKNSYQQLRLLASGVRKNLNSDDIKTFPISYPSVPFQTRIADVLFCLDKKIDLNKRITAELEAMAKTIYDYWFVQFDFPAENGKPYRTSGGAMEWNEQLKREIPKGWKCCTLNEMVTIDNTSVNPASLGYTVMEHYSIPAFDDSHYPSFENAEIIESGKYAVCPGAILVSKLNPKFKRIWDPFCITDTSICSTEFMVYRARKAELRPFCFAVVNSDGFYGHMTAKAISSTGSRSRIQPDVSLTYSFAAPKDDLLLQSFCKTYFPIMDRQKKLHMENHELTQLRDWLLPMLMNGQATVE